MSNNVFPSLPGLGWSVIQAPQWNTKTQIATSGKELRSAWFSAPKWGIKLTYEILRATTGFTELQTLLGFFNARQGSFDSFLYDNPNDDSVTAQSIGTGNGATTQFQLARTYGGAVEPVMNVNAITGIYLNGVATSAYTINSLGLVTFTTAPGAGVAVTWTGTYYYRCRFVKDTADFEEFMYQLWSLKELEFIGSLGNKI
jgi:uncharacterized protein (TIGR02217 family)